MLLKKFKFFQKEPSYFKIVFFRNKKFFVFKNYSSETIKYLHIPNSIKIKKEASFFIFSIEVSKSNKILENFYNSFILFLKNNNKIFCKKLLLKGLGFRLSIFKDKNLLSCRILKLKVGFSHFIYIKIPSNLHVTTNKKKTTLNIKSQNINFLGNFCSSLRSIKKINVYNGKGFWYKKEKKTLKIFKKK
jgi:ribosomal protein L6P/L9E